MPLAIPSHLPDRLTISLWDFTWFTQTTPGEPFHDLDAAFREAVERGYNTVRICAMPYLLYGNHGIDTTALRFANIGGNVGQRTRWYNAAGGAVLDGRRHLRELFEAARRHDCYVILSSWEYQQSPSFLATSAWYDALMAVPHGSRHDALADAMSRLIQDLEDHGLADRIAYAEVHNEADLSRLKPDPDDPYWSQRDLHSAAVDRMRKAHPDILMTTCYATAPYDDMASVPDNGQVAHFHMYVYGVLRALRDWSGERLSRPPFPTPELRSLLRDDAPDVDAYTEGIEPWKVKASGQTTSMFYCHDWVDPARWDRWLYEHFHEYRESMYQALDDNLATIAAWAAERDVPAVIGEGWIGYTPLYTEFEDGPVGQGLAEHALTRAIEHGYWGVVLGSNSAPHHPGWRDVAWQQKWNARLLERENV